MTIINSIVEQNLTYLYPTGGVMAHKGRIGQPVGGIQRRWVCYSANGSSSNPTEIHVAYSDDNGATWTVEVPVSIGWLCYFCAMGIDANDNLYLVWQMYNPSSGWNIYAAKRNAIGGTWTQLDGVTPGFDLITTGLDVGSGISPPECVVDYNGVVHIVFSIRNYFTISDIFYTNSTERATWPFNYSYLPHKIDNYTGSQAAAYGGCMAVSADNTVHFTYYGRDLDVNEFCFIAFYKTRSVGGVWSAESRIYDPNAAGTCSGDGMGMQYPTIEIDPADDTLYFACMMNTTLTAPGYQVGFAKKKFGHPWSSVTAITNDPVYPSNIPKISIDAQRNIYLAWYGQGTPLNPSQTNVRYKMFIFAASTWGPTVNITDLLVGGQFHVLSYMNTFSLLPKGMNVSWRAPENNIEVKFYGTDESPVLGPRYGPPRVMMTGDNL